jgi:hypothetical protein
MEATMGTWSETKRVREEIDEFGNVLAHSRLMKALSIFCSVGFCRLLDQVNALSRSGNSIRERVDCVVETVGFVLPKVVVIFVC